MGICEQEKTRKVNKILKFIVVLLAFALYFVLRHVLPFDENASRGVALLACIALLWLTEALPIYVTALLVPVMGALVGITNEAGNVVTLKDALLGFASPTVFLVMGGFALAASLHVNELDKKLTQYVMAICGSNVLACVFGVFVLAAVLSMWMSNTATAALMLPIMLGLAETLPQDESLGRNKVFMLLGVAYCCSIGGIGTMVGSPTNAIAAQELGYSFSDWLRIGMPLTVLLLPVMVLVLFALFRPKLNFKFDRRKFEEYIPWTLKRVLAIVVFALVALAWIFGELIRDATHLPITDAWVALVGIFLIALLNIASWRQIADEVDWGVLLLFGGGLSLSALLSMSGGSYQLAVLLEQWVGNAPAFLVVVVVATFIIFLTEMTSNTAAAALLVPMFATIGVQMGLPREVLPVVIGVGASCAFMMPVATPPNALVYGTGLIAQRDMLRAGLLLNVLSVIIVSLYSYFVL